MLVRINGEVKAPLNKTLKFGFDDEMRMDLFSDRTSHIGFLEPTKEANVFTFKVDEIRGQNLRALNENTASADKSLMLKALNYDYELEGAYEIL